MLIDLTATRFLGLKHLTATSLFVQSSFVELRLEVLPVVQASLCGIVQFSRDHSDQPVGGDGFVQYGGV